MRLFDPDQRPAARVTDPTTSHLAALSVTGLREKQCAVLAMFGTTPMSDEELVLNYNVAAMSGVAPPQSVSGIRTRRHELVVKGLLVDAGRGATSSGRSCILWARPT
jgi:hypothetical protein